MKTKVDVVEVHKDSYLRRLKYFATMQQAVKLQKDWQVLLVLWED